MTADRRAASLHRSLPVVDGHNDLPWEIRVRAAGSLAAADPRTQLDGYHTDLPRLLEGGVGVQFWSVFVPAWTREPRRTTHEQIDLVDEMSDLAPDLTAMAATADEARRIRDGGRVAGFLGVEGGHSIEGDLGAIEEFHSRGARYMTLTHGTSIEWADSATDEPRHDGLTEFGRQVVAEMNRVGMLVDVSHVSADTMRHAVEASRAPVIASHSSAYALAPHPRNVPDDVIQMIAGRGGVVMVTFVPAFLVRETALEAVDMFEDMRRLRARFGPDEEEAYTRAYKEEFGTRQIDRGTVADVVDHIEHIAGVAGVEHVGIGSDFDGTEQLPEGLHDVTTYPAITAELLARGWAEPDVLAILGGNALRALEHAEDLASRSG